MLIDCHAHAGDFRWSPKDRRPPMTWARLLKRLDDEGIDKAVVLPVYNASPEMFPWSFLHCRGQSIREQVLAAGRHRDRIICFGNMDPRWSKNSSDSDLGSIIDWFQDHGCKGIGEVCANIPFDDPRTVNMFGQLGERGMPVIVETCGWSWGLGFQDKPGAPCLERLLQQVPDTKIIGHGPGFWAEIAPVERDDDKIRYNKGPITREGSLARLLRAYPNLYADISAASGFNALSRDLQYAVRFLNEFQDKLLFGTDIISRDFRLTSIETKAIEALLETLFRVGHIHENDWHMVNWHNGLMPQLPFLQELVKRGLLSPDAYEKITGGNVLRLLGYS